MVLPRERITYAELAVVVGLVAACGAMTPSDPHSVEEHPEEDIAAS